MKKLTKKTYLLTLITFNFIVLAQVNKLNDPSIVAQHKRMTFQSWGDWRPYPKYFLGIQTNFAYATVWGMWSPNRNQEYKNGPDIRPLRPTGEQNLRLAQLKLQEEEAKKIKAASDTIYKRSVQDFAHWTSLTVEADPLWLLYYKRMLKPITEFPDNPQNYQDWGFSNFKIYKTLNTTGTLLRLKEDLDIIKEKYSISRSLDMPRGKRFLMYHHTLIKWRKFINEIRGYNDKTNLLLDYRNIIGNHNPTTSGSSPTPKSDVDIIKKIMNNIKYKF